ncbi:MAG TPA: hypothetical protein VFU13_22810 [Steroidobacteraceae bacterium]|nr:hypothetical protein [Steroidobacteraceae bacterium]
MRTAVLAAIGILTIGTAMGGSLELQATIPLPNCKGRIDHLAFDSEHHRLFVAELGNDTVAVIDVDQSASIPWRSACTSAMAKVHWLFSIRNLWIASEIFH